jgi:hypothetical protein
MNTWSVELRSEWVGCGYAYIHEVSEQKMIKSVSAEVIATGWVTNGLMAVNNQFITKNTKACILDVNYEQE